MYNTKLHGCGQGEGQCNAALIHQWHVAIINRIFEHSIWIAIFES